MTSFNLTRSTLTVGAGLARSYASSTIKGSIQDGGSNFNAFGFSAKAKYTKTMFTPDVIHEGDRITDAFGAVYDVHNVSLEPFGDQFICYQCELFQLKTVTYRARSSLGVYTESTVYMNLAVAGQAQLQPKIHYGLTDYIGVTSAIVKEGDQIEDTDGKFYTVMGVTEYPSGRTDGFNWFVVALTPRFPEVTLGTLTLGNADSTTGIYASSYASSTIRMVISAKGQNLTRLTAGYINRYDYVGVTDSIVYEGDKVTVGSVSYEVMQVHSYLATRTDYSLSWYVCGLIKRDFADAPATSGTWHVDSASISTDPRHRQKVLIAAYYTAANVKLDDNSTNASTLTCFDGATYPITRLFTTKSLDVIAVISRNDTTTIYTDKLLGHKPCGTQEQVKITICAVNKTTATATRLAEAYESELKRIYTVYDPISTVRDIQGIQPKITDLGFGYMCETSILIEYKRPLDSYTAALPTITYGDNQGSTYTYPNAIEIQFRDPDTGDIRLLPPNRLGSILQISGSDDFEITIKADLDLDASNKTWKRNQSTSSKTDTVNWQVFTEIKFGGKTDADQVYQNLNWAGTAIPVRLVDFSVDGNILTTTYRRYSENSGSSGTSKAWYGIS